MRPAFLIPLILFGLVAVALGIGLGLRPAEIPSALIGQPVPTFALAGVKGFGPGLASGDLKGQVAIVNVFASWCVPCRAEHPLWMDVAKSGEVVLYGLNYKDDAENAARWLETFGNPFQRICTDANGRVGIDFGVYGVPETFVIDRNGVIRMKHIGPIDRAVLDGEILPKVRELQHEAPATPPPQQAQQR